MAANGVAHHLAQKSRFRRRRRRRRPDAARIRSRARLGQAAPAQRRQQNTFKFDFGSENPDGGQDSTLSVFTRDADGAVRHFYTAHPWMSPEIRERGIDLLSPIWHFARSHAARPRQLVREPRLRHESPGRIEIDDGVRLLPLSNYRKLRHGDLPNRTG